MCCFQELRELFFSFSFTVFWMGSVAPFEEILSRICILLKMIGVCSAQILEKSGTLLLQICKNM
ncbi:unnamed protein product [Musa acuminata subsp. malaccensis]|uniref:(wild Malaysian banana) hypothetical protein n=1 Tax=Musa acuminata subsp. malaccensis TaxID=214687 RepID=A0A804K3H0_MUSAM|nr:unnamed protein product [Musa acuminata subsp. malaccensis]